MAADPPTLGSTRAMGIVALDAHCLLRDRFSQAGCGHTGPIALDALRLPDGTIWTRIPWRRRLICLRCGTRSYEISMDWRGYYRRYDERFLAPEAMRVKRQAEPPPDRDTTETDLS